MGAFQFPRNFFWGASTSAHQVEGHNIHSDWWAWEQAGRVKERSGPACDHYRRFPADFDLAASLGQTMHRFSIEWARLEPEEGRWDDAALAHYVEVVRALRARHLEPLMTLHHFTNPQWFLAQGGWTRTDAPEKFARYVERVVQALGPLVRHWITINEPMVYTRMHYVQGLGPPGVTDFRQALPVIHNLIRAHAVAYRGIHEAAPPGQPPSVSIAHHAPAFRPCRWWSPMDRLMTARTDQLFYTAFFEAITEGRWAVPGIGRWEFPEARRTCDFLGINYYGRQFIRWVPKPGQWPADSCDLGHHRVAVKERTSLGWDVAPEAFQRVLEDAGRFGLPILVTENGTWMEDDARRTRFLERHIEAMARAMQNGAPVIGYCVWSLMDNFEWAEGYTPRFGLVEVDYATQARRVRASGQRFAAICRANRIEWELR